MARTYTVDASVFLNGFNPYELGHEESRELLRFLQDQSIPIIVPTLLLPEVAAAISRGRRDLEQGYGFAAALRRLPHLVLVPLDEGLAEQAAETAAQCCLRGSDAVYAAVAWRFGSVLVTLDNEQRERSSEVIPTRLPAEALAELGP
jgi:predicted nucleic acid-binding protein